MVLLVHRTSYEYLSDILKDGALRPASEHGNEGEGGFEDGVLEEVYLSVLHPYQTLSTKWGLPILFFKSDVLKKYNTKHWSPIWLYGEFDKENGSIKYYKSKTPEKNLEVWSEEYRKYHPRKYDLVLEMGLNSDEVVIKDTIPFEGNLVGIFAPDKEDLKEYKINIPPELHIKTRPALTKFLKQHGYA